MIKKNTPIKKIPLKNLSDVKNLVVNTASTLLAIGVGSKLKPIVGAYKAGKRVEQFKRSGQYSFTNLSYGVYQFYGISYSTGLKTLCEYDNGNLTVIEEFDNDTDVFFMLQIGNFN